MFYDATTGERAKIDFLPSSQRSYFHQRPPPIVRQLIVRSDFVLWDLATGQERLRLPGYNGVNLIRHQSRRQSSRLGKSLRVRRRRERVDALESEVRQATAGAQTPGDRRRISFSPDGNRLVAAFSQSGPTALKPIQIWDATPLPEEP